MQRERERWYNENIWKMLNSKVDLENLIRLYMASWLIKVPLLPLHPFVLLFNVALHFICSWEKDLLSGIDYSVCAICKLCSFKLSLYICIYIYIECSLPSFILLDTLLSFGRHTLVPFLSTFQVYPS